MSSPVTIEITSPAWTGVGADWPAVSTPPSGAQLVEGCWILGLPTARFSVDRTITEGVIGYVKGDDASAHPLLAKLLELEQVYSVIAKGGSLLVSARTADGWTDQVKQIITDQLAVDEAAIRERVQEVLDREINPGVASHGGYIEILDVKGTTVFIKMGGGCQGCGMASVTLKQGVERSIRAGVPEVDRILDTTDHAAGGNPYYAPQTK